jgi:TatD DNase family protein
MLDDPIDEALTAARAANITRVVTVGCDVASSRWAADCAASRPDVYAAVAIHPNNTAPASGPQPVPAPASGSIARLPSLERVDYAIDQLKEIANLANRPDVVAVGETGLDYYWDDSPPEVQQRFFREHIAIAKRAGKALMIHDRDAHADVLRILAEEGPPPQVIFHCFSGDAEMAKQCAGNGYVMSFAGTVTFKNAAPLREAALLAPPELILAETDAPYLTPMPNRGKRNSPAMTAYTIRFLARLKGLDLGEFCDTLTANAARVFGWA